MKRTMAVAISACVMVLGLGGCASEGGSGLTAKPVVEKASTAKTSSPKPSASGTPKTMRAFGSEKELVAYLRELAERQKSVLRGKASADLVYAPAAKMALVTTAASQSETESVTSVQHAGVDEGGIVKVRGNHLVVLRRGRLFTISIEAGDLTPVSCVNAFGPDIDPTRTWYDEMLVSNDTVVVIGYSYERGGTEVGLFHIDGEGMLTYRSTYQLRSNDYYSSRNYASRLIGSKLIFYSPLYLSPTAADPFQGFPAVRRWHKGATASEFKRIVSAPQVYRPEPPLESFYDSALHTVTVCDLAGGDFDCKATSIMGPPVRVFYVSPSAVYIWATSWRNHEDQQPGQSMIYRMPLDGSAPSALKASGTPVDQFSFLESEDGYLNVLVRSEPAGDGMWGAEASAGGVRLMRVRLESFSDGSGAAPASSYRKLPRPNGFTFQNRFVGDYLLYGTGSGWWNVQKAERSHLYAVRWAGGDVYDVALDHGTDRIEAMGSDAVVVGTDGKDLHFTSVRLSDVPEVSDDYVEKGASQGELRSHGFFYKAVAEDTGMLGLPISVPARPGYRHLFESSAAIVFLKNDALHFREMGELGAQPERAKDDGCRASCVDWYGNSQPLFLRGRIFALLGYELVEGSLEKGRIWETRRVNYSEPGVALSRR